MRSSLRWKQLENLAMGAKNQAVLYRTKVQIGSKSNWEGCIKRLQNQP